MKLKTTITRILLAILFLAISYAIVSGFVYLLCGSLLFIFKNPVHALIVVLNIMALGLAFNAIYLAYKSQK